MSNNPFRQQMEHAAHLELQTQSDLQDANSSPHLNGNSSTPAHFSNTNGNYYSNGSVLVTDTQRNGFSTLPEVLPQEQQSSDSSLPEDRTSTTPSSVQQNGHHGDSLSEAVESLQLEDQFPEAVAQPRHAHVPSFSQVRKESLSNSRPTYIRALSSQIQEMEAPRMTPEDAHAEVLRRLGKAERTVKTLKRRGSNESLSSLLSYSIRRPSIPSRSKSGHSLDALAAVLEDAAQEGNLSLVEAVMGLGADPNFRSINRLKNRRHDALNKATAAGHVDVIDYLLRQGATYDLGDTPRKDPFSPMDYKLLDLAYSGYGRVANYLVTSHNANPFVEQWPREYFDAKRTVYRRVIPAKVYQRTVVDAIVRIGNEDEDSTLLETIMHKPSFDPTTISMRIYEDTPYSGDGTRMLQTTYHYSALSAFTKAGWATAVQDLLSTTSHPSAYELPPTASFEEGQIPSSNYSRYIYPSNALTRDTWLYHPNSSLRILTLLLKNNFSMNTPQRTPDDSAPRTPAARAILADAHLGIDLLFSSRPDLVREEISFRLLLKDGVEQEYKAQPLAAAIIQGSLNTARVILRCGARPTDPAFACGNVLLFAAGHGGKAAVGVLGDMVRMAPELLAEALEVAIQKVKVECVRVLLEVGDGEGLEGLGLYDSLLRCKGVMRDRDVMERYAAIIEMVYRADGEKRLKRPEEGSVRDAVAMGNLVGVEKLRELGVVDI